MLNSFFVFVSSCFKSRLTNQFSFPKLSSVIATLRNICHVMYHFVTLKKRIFFYLKQPWKNIKMDENFQNSASLECFLT